MSVPYTEVSWAGPGNEHQQYECSIYRGKLGGAWERASAICQFSAMPVHTPSIARIQRSKARTENKLVKGNKIM